ncbi:MAG: caspase family protein [Verrucomicrobiaceae bacterium]|nr:caspase family protein [Verrucomicrobiaceae bacterium]
MCRSFLLPALVLSWLPAFAAERVALVIGNDAYRHARPLKAAVSDASAVASTLQKLGFETITASNAGLESMVEALERLKARAQGADAVLVYYAGHGIESGGVNYLVPVDARLEREIQLKTQTLSVDDILGELKALTVPARMVILDCCRNNPLEGRSWLATRSSSGGGLAAMSQDTLAEATLVVFAASPGKPALDQVDGADTHSPFTTALLNEMPKPGVHSFEMFGMVEDSVIRQTGGRQSPRLFYNGSTQPFRNFRFSAAPLPTPPTPAPTLPTTVHASATPPTPSLTMPQPVVDSPPSTAPAMPELPQRGYFDLDQLFATGPYAAYNSYSRGHILKQAQTKLKAAGLYASRADGVPGPSTQSAILAHQQAQSLPLSGKLDAATIGSLGLDRIQQMTAPKPQHQTPSGKPSPSRLTPEQRVLRALTTGPQA